MVGTCASIQAQSFAVSSNAGQSFVKQPWLGQTWLQLHRRKPWRLYLILDVQNVERNVGQVEVGKEGSLSVGAILLFSTIILVISVTGDHNLFVGGSAVSCANDC